MDSNALGRELASLADTIIVSNPISFGQTVEWCTTQKNAELAAKQENETLPQTFGLTEQQKDIKAVDNLFRMAQGAPPARVPIAKRSHMDGILRGVPGGLKQMRTVQQRAFVYDSEMDNMNRDKETRHHRKRDAYSNYVEARARFSKMHSVK